jgi:hypothetical protein
MGRKAKSENAQASGSKGKLRETEDIEDEVVDVDMEERKPRKKVKH